MNQSTGERLIDEHEIRAALRPWRPDRQSFADGVRNRVEAAVKQRSDAHWNDSASASDPRPSEWLRIAASFIPIHLLGRSFDTSVAPISFAAISLGKKVVVVLAFPFLCFLMIGLTVIGMMRIRALQHDQGSASIDIEQARQATAQWWKRYGWIAAIVFTGALLAPFFGWSMPLMVALVCSGFAAVSLVRTLAKENLVDRTVVGGSCVAGLGILGQLSATFANMSSSQFLDPYLVTGVLFSGSFMIGALLRPPAWTGQGARASFKQANENGPAGDIRHQQHRIGLSGISAGFLLAVNLDCDWSGCGRDPVGDSSSSYVNQQNLDDWRRAGSLPDHDSVFEVVLGRSDPSGPSALR